MTPDPVDLMPMVDITLLVHPPYTDSEITSYNPKVIEVYCATCVYRTRTDLIAPKCGICKNSLYVVVRSHLSREQRNELAGNNSKST